MKIPGATEDSTESAGPAKSSHRRRIITFIIIIGINVGLLTALGFALLTPAAKLSNLPANSAAGLGDVSSSLIGRPAPDFVLPALNEDNSTVHLADFKGKVVVLNFWQSSCDPCNTEAPFMQKTWTQLQAKGVVFIGVDMLDTSGGAHAFLRKYGITYPNVEDTLNSATGSSYGINGLPETYFIDQHGVVASKWIAPLSAQGLQFELAKLHMKVAIK